MSYMNWFVATRVCISIALSYLESQYNCIMTEVLDEEEDKQPDGR